MRKLSLPPVSPGKRAALLLHLVGGLPGARDHFADAAHRLRIGADHADRAQVVQNILGGDRFAANPAFGERHILRQILIEMMADHQHVEMLIERVDGVGPRGIGGTGQHVRLAADADDVRRVAAARAFGVIGVNRAALERGDRCLRQSRIRSACRCESSPARRVHRRRSGSNRSRRASCPSLRAASGRSRRRESARPSPSGLAVLPLPVKPKFSGRCIGGLQHHAHDDASRACRWWRRCRWPGRCRRRPSWSARRRSLRAPAAGR